MHPNFPRTPTVLYRIPALQTATARTATHGSKTVTKRHCRPHTRQLCAILPPPQSTPPLPTPPPPPPHLLSMAHSVIAHITFQFLFAVTEWMLCSCAITEWAIHFSTTQRNLSYLFKLFKASSVLSWWTVGGEGGWGTGGVNSGGGKLSLSWRVCSRLHTRYFCANLPSPQFIRISVSGIEILVPNKWVAISFLSFFAVQIGLLYIFSGSQVVVSPATLFIRK